LKNAIFLAKWCKWSQDGRRNAHCTPTSHVSQSLTFLWFVYFMCTLGAGNRASVWAEMQIGHVGGVLLRGQPRRLCKNCKKEEPSACSSRTIWLVKGWAAGGGVWVVLHVRHVSVWKILLKRYKIFHSHSWTTKWNSILRGGRYVLSHTSFFCASIPCVSLW